jgi:uncharacterized protein YqgC (DUF456 family)
MAVFRSFFDPAIPSFFFLFFFLLISSLHKKKKTLLCLWVRFGLVVFVSILGYGLDMTHQKEKKNGEKERRIGRGGGEKKS